jgi:hypothetical protein
MSSGRYYKEKYQEQKRIYLELKRKQKQMGGEQAITGTIRNKLNDLNIQLLVPGTSATHTTDCNLDLCGLLVSNLPSSSQKKCSCNQLYRFILTDLIKQYHFAVFKTPKHLLSKEQTIHVPIISSRINLDTEGRVLNLDSPITDKMNKWIDCSYLNTKSQCFISPIDLTVRITIELDSHISIPKDAYLSGFATNTNGPTHIWVSEHGWHRDNHLLSLNYIIKSETEQPKKITNLINPQNKNEEKLLEEMISTEVSYIVSLYQAEYLLDDLHNSKLDKLKELLIEIRKLHYSMLLELMNQTTASGIADVLNRFFNNPKLKKLYIDYHKEYKTSQKLLTPSIDSKTIAVTQRLPRYELLLRELNKGMIGETSYSKAMASVQSILNSFAKSK